MRRTPLGIRRFFPRVHRRAYSGPVSDHFDGRRFFNPWDRTSRNIFGFLKWRLTADAAPWPASLPVTRQDVPPPRVEGDALRLTFVGHATVLVQTAGLNILTDPIWSERASPLDSRGPKRVRRPGLPFDKLPRIDAVLVTHNHYDHLDLPTLAALWRRDRPRIICPLGNTALIGRAKGAVATELDWWEWTDVRPGAPGTAGTPGTPGTPGWSQGTPGTPGAPRSGNAGASGDAGASGGAKDGAESQNPPAGVRVHLAPCHHWSARGVFDRRAALWGAFVIEAPGGKVYFCGDTGYGGGVPFRMARERFGSFRVALLPIGAYEPRWFLAQTHMNPEEAVRAFLDLNAKQAAALHHGVFRLTDEAIGQPLTDLAAALADHAVSPDLFRTPEVGEGWDVP